MELRGKVPQGRVSNPPVPLTVPGPCMECPDRPREAGATPLLHVRSLRFGSEVGARPQPRAVSGGAGTGSSWDCTSVRAPRCCAPSQGRLVIEEALVKRGARGHIQ